MLFSLIKQVFTEYKYDFGEEITLFGMTIRRVAGTWAIEYNGANRPIRFRNEETDTTVDCGYDSQGHRYFKKVTVAGTVTLHHRYIYRGYLQIACVDCTRSGHPALWLVTWDPSQPTATRPLALQKDGNWFTYGYDITKNICEVFGPAGYIRTAYSYAPFGAVTESGDVTQPFQWSSEHYDSELDLVYYNYRHYSPSLGRFLSRDPIAEQGGRNLYAFVKNSVGFSYDFHGLTCAECSKAVTSAWHKLEEYRKALEQLENKNQDGKMSPKKCKVNKPTCKKSDIKNCHGGEAFFTRCSDAPTHQLNVVGTVTVLCGFQGEDFSDLESLIYHELYHAFQFCMGETDFKETTCAELVKLEIDAYCAMLNTFPVIEVGASHRNMILSKVKMSVEKYDACKEPGLVESFFDEFYNEDSCKTKRLPKK